MNFLTSSDYDFLIQDEIYQVITDNNEGIRDQSESAAMEEMKGYLRKRYDVAKIFLPVIPYSNSATYTPGSIVEYNMQGAIMYSDDTDFTMGDIVKYDGGLGLRTYLCLQDCTGKSPEDQQYFKRVTATYTAKVNTTGIAPPDTSKWQEGDVRSALVIMFLLDMVIYHIHARIAPQNVPVIRENRYNAAIKYLRDVQKGDITPDLPPVTDSAGNQITEEIQYNSYPKLKYPK